LFLPLGWSGLDRRFGLNAQGAARILKK
jgi:hypothetical protein